MSAPDTTPNPGSKEAIALGCECPVMDNGHGRGSGWPSKDGKPLFWSVGSCPLHGEAHSSITTNNKEIYD